MAIGELDAIPFQELHAWYARGLQPLWGAQAGGHTHSCNCLGPRNGDPLCPCMMVGVKIVDGRYIRTQDLGPAPAWKLTRKDTPCSD